MTNKEVPSSIVTRDMAKIVIPTGNVYESLNVIGKRARQIAVVHKEEISNKLSEFSVGVDNLEEVHENREQIEISRQFERQPKPTNLAIEEFLEGKIYMRVVSEEELAQHPM